MMSRLAALSEEPIVNEQDSSSSSSSTNNNRSSSNSKKTQSWRSWLKAYFPLMLSNNKSEHLRLLLSVLGCPLFPLSIPNSNPITTQRVSSSAQYIIQHFTAATACRKAEGVLNNVYATGKVVMAMADDLASTGLVVAAGGSAAGVSQKGCFVIWQMVPNKWLIELVVGGNKVVAGSDGNLAWRHTSWLGCHAAKGGVRPLRRAFQGLDPLAIAAVFSSAEYIGEKRTSGVDCFVLKLSADQPDLAERSDNTAELIKHVMFGYFSQRSGLLVYLEDSYLTRIQPPGSYPTYWETTMGTKIEDYRSVEGLMVAHTGHSTAMITRFGDNLRAGPVTTRMVESWTIDDLAFNVPGLSDDCFIPLEDVHKDDSDEKLDWRSPWHQYQHR